jgi:hypothetical protein
MFHFDPTVSLGDVLMLATFAASLIAGWAIIKLKVKNLEDWRDNHEEMVKEQSKVFTDLRIAVEGLTRVVDTMDRRVDRLENGKYRGHEGAVGA